MIGRFAIELWRGVELVERVRFDFPLLGASDPSGSTRNGINMELGLETERDVWVPLLREATRAQIVDRKTGDIVNLSWPPPGLQLSAD
jgi:hypothetical protein